jgi:hypothetical protein
MLNRTMAVLCRSKQLWELVNDEDAIKAEREKARQNRNKYGGIDSHGFSMHTGPHVAKFNGSSTASSAAAVACGAGSQVEATQKRIDDLTVSSAGGASATSAVEGSVPAGAPEKLKLSQIQVNISLMLLSVPTRRRREHTDSTLLAEKRLA